VYLEKLLAKRWLIYLRPIVILIPIVIMMPIFKFVLPVLSPDKIAENTDSFERIGLLKWEDGKNHALPQDFADMLGWSELVGIVDIENTLIHCDNYGQAGAINFYSNQKFTQAVSMNADYINWYPLDNMEIKNVILVKENTDLDVNREKEMPLFDQIITIREIRNKYAREHGTKVYLLKGAKQSINEILKEEIEERKNKR